MSFSIHRVADISADGIYTLTGNFADYPVSLEDLDNSGWRALAQTLAAYTARDELQPLLIQETERDGRSHFPALTTGLYLVIGEPYTAENTVYISEPMLISLPGLTGEGSWDYDAEAVCKFNREERRPGTRYLRVRRSGRTKATKRNARRKSLFSFWKMGRLWIP